MTVATATNRPEPICGSETWLPVAARIRSEQRENYNTRTFQLQIVDRAIRERYRWAPGQFNMLYVPGVGEAAISLSSDSETPQTLEHTVRIVGSVTRAMDKLGAQRGLVGLRGPFGMGWPRHLVDGHDVILLAGGIGLAPLRPMVYWLLRNRTRCRRLVLLFGCRSPEDRIFVPELDAWAAERAIDLLVTVDNATPEWTGPVGVVTNLVKRIKVNADRTLVMVCGPRILNRVAAWSFLQLHVPASQIFVSLERNMNCGFGHCGHCQYGPKFVCTDGPVFSFEAISDIFAKEEI